MNIKSSTCHYIIIICMALKILDVIYILLPHSEGFMNRRKIGTSSLVGLRNGGKIKPPASPRLCHELTEKNRDQHRKAKELKRRTHWLSQDKHNEVHPQPSIPSTNSPTCDSPPETFNDQNGCLQSKENHGCRVESPTHRVHR